MTESTGNSFPPPEMPSVDGAGGSSSRREDKRARKAEAKTQRADAKVERKRRAAEAAIVDPQVHGAVIASAVFGGRSIKVFQNGYVKVAWTLMEKKAPVEELVSILDDANITKKSGLGRGAAAVATGGLNLLSSNKRGDLYLTIVTTTNTYTLHEESPSSGDMRAAKTLAAAALRVTPISGTGESAPTEPSSIEIPAGTSVADRLRDLAVLHAEGILSDGEYQEKKAELLKML